MIQNRTGITDEREPMLPSSTMLERRSLDGAINMTDGHARHELLPFEEHIVSSLPALFNTSSLIDQTEAEDYFLRSFFRLAGQSLHRNNLFINFSASTSTLLVGKILRDLNCRLHVPYPAFDNLVNLLKWLHFDLVPYAEDFDTLLNVCASCDSRDAIWVFWPNNPTGTSLSEEQFGRLIETACRNGATLIFDFCFRFFCRQLCNFDQYRALAASGLRYFAIEDTGKTWNTNDTKISPVSCSDHFHEPLFAAHDNLLLNISRFHLLHLGKLLEHTHEQGLDTVIWERFARKRRILESSLRHLPFDWDPKLPSTPLLWLRETAPGLARHFVRRCLDAGVHVLPGNQFFWQDLQMGNPFVRIPLARPDAVLTQVADIFGSLQLG